MTLNSMYDRPYADGSEVIHRLKICEYCGKEFRSRNLSAEVIQVYCSKQCGAKYRWKNAHYKGVSI